MRAAEVQHHVMVEVRRRLVRTEHLWDEPMESVSAEIGFEPQRLGRLMGGHYRLGMRDLAALEGVFGPILVLLNYERAPIADESLRRRFHLDSARWGID